MTTERALPVPRMVRWLLSPLLVCILIFPLVWVDLLALAEKAGMRVQTVVDSSPSAILIAPAVPAAGVAAFLSMWSAIFHRFSRSSVLVASLIFGAVSFLLFVSFSRW